MSGPFSILRALFSISVLSLVVAATACPGRPAATAPPTAKKVVAEDASSVSFVVVGDYGVASKGGSQQTAETQVARMVQQWIGEGAAAVFTVGDNNYGDHDTGGYDDNVGTFFCDLMAGYQGALGQNNQGIHCGRSGQMFYPSPGNHDYTSHGGYGPYEAYFPWAKTGDQYYYSVGLPSESSDLVRVFSLNSNCSATDSSGSNHGCPRSPNDCEDQYAAQLSQMARQMDGDKAVWNLALFHHPPYSLAGETGCQRMADFDFPNNPLLKNLAGYGVAAVITGHSHLYERVVMQATPNFPYIVNGIGGRSQDSCGSCSYAPSGIQSGYCESGKFGATLVRATPTQLTISTVSTNGLLLDECVLTDPGPNQQMTCTTGIRACVGP